MSGPLNGSSTDITPGVVGSNSSSGLGVWGLSDSGNGVYGSSASGCGVRGSSSSGNAGQFEGNVVVSGKLMASDVILSGSDCAEEFDTASAADLEPGTVVVFDDHGSIDESRRAYDKRVAGVISGAGMYRPALIMGRTDHSSESTAPVALLGRTYCRVDASYAPIDVGDMLTTSPTSGCAMKAIDPGMAFGAVIGKALAAVSHGRGLIPILVTLV